MFTLMKCMVLCTAGLMILSIYLYGSPGRTASSLFSLPAMLGPVVPIEPGCPDKIPELIASMPDTYTASGKLSGTAAVEGGLEEELGDPLSRRPRTAIVNMVSYHEEVVAAVGYHLLKLRHNVTVFTKATALGMEEVVRPFLWKGFRRYEAFFAAFHDFDCVLLITFPTCHLPQTYVVMVHNALALEQEAAVRAIRASGAKILTIAPHVQAAAQRRAAAQGVQVDSGWVAPMFPVIFPEECVEGSWRRVLPACRPVYINDTLAGLSPAAEPGAEAARPRSGICLQGKLDQSRRDYTGIFSQLQEQAEELAASNFTLVIQVLGVGVGLRGKGADVTVPQDLIDRGIVEHYSFLPFQEYYEVMHGCVAILPAFSSDEYYTDRASSTMGAALISATPLIATPEMLRVYSFLSRESVFLVDPTLPYVEMLEDLLGPRPLLKGPDGTPRSMANAATWGTAETRRWQEELETAAQLPPLQDDAES
ncbi:hypothetical protein F751_6864 [Auxenochlorella protothecoides]|uniref:Glycosyl transferase family 1 domain-containing protein n=1 Tax=Auxenochlorella protothecoides TaxID=3075 RepID=A0A087SDU2_AUXPR|nr:hypothetical protein F751_6864 [Auxenochlorella protothecoides]KFM23896.1 hypothetical protein F751_6864 [Auxenochlorella protothecoides]